MSLLITSVAFVDALSIENILTEILLGHHRSFYKLLEKDLADVTKQFLLLLFAVFAFDCWAHLLDDLVDATVIRKDGIDEHEVAVVILELPEILLVVTLHTLFKFLLGGELKRFDEGRVPFEQLFVLVEHG